MMAIRPLQQEALEGIRNPAQGLSSIGTAFLQAQQAKQQKMDSELRRKVMETQMSNTEVDRQIQYNSVLGDQYAALAEIYSANPNANPMALQGSVQKMMQGVPEPVKKNFVMPNNYQEALQGLARAQKLTEYLSAKSKSQAKKIESGLIVDKETKEIVGSGSRQDGTVTADLEGSFNPEKHVFVQGASPYTETIKEKGASAKESEAEKAKFKSQIEERKLITESADMASTRMDQLTRMDQILSQAELGGGPIEPLLAKFGNLTSSLGMDFAAPRNMVDMYNIQRDFSKLVLENAKTQKGNLNQSEHETVIQATGSASDPKAAAQISVKAAKEVARRALTRKEMMDDFSAQNKSDIEGFSKQWNQYMDQWPIVKRKKNSDDSVEILFLSEAKDKMVAGIARRAAELPQAERRQYIEKEMQKFQKWWTSQ